MNISELIGPQRDSYSFKTYSFNSYVDFPSYGSLQRTFNAFSGMVFSLYSGHCFDGGDRFF